MKGPLGQVADLPPICKTVLDRVWGLGWYVLVSMSALREPQVDPQSQEQFPIILGRNPEEANFGFPTTVDVCSRCENQWNGEGVWEPVNRDALRVPSEVSG